MFDAKNSIHQSDEQLKRQISARKVTVQEINCENQTGVINDYIVTLDTCSCRDWSVRRLPCKHIYRLAHELGLFHLPGKEILQTKNLVLNKNLFNEIQKIAIKEAALPFTPQSYNLSLTLDVTHDGLTYSKSYMILGGTENER